MNRNNDILDNISTAVLALNGQLLVTAANSAAQALLEVSLTRAIDQHASQSA